MNNPRKHPLWPKYKQFLDKGIIKVPSFQAYICGYNDGKFEGWDMARKKYKEDEKMLDDLAEEYDVHEVGAAASEGGGHEDNV